MNELTTTQQANPFALTSFEAVEKMATYIADAGMYGIKKPAQAITLMMLAHEEKQTLSQLLRRIHVFEDGKISQRADYTQGDFQASGNTIIFHARADDMVAATFVMGKADDAARERGIKRFELLWFLDSEQKPAERSRLLVEIAKLSRDGEETIIRTFADAEAKGITEGSKGMKQNWKTSPRQMLTARCVTEGIKVVDPARAAGLYSEDEVEDIRKFEVQDKQHRLENNDRSAMEEIQHQHEQSAREAKNDSDRKHYQSLASDMRCKIADMDVKEVTVGARRFVKPTPEKPNGESFLESPTDQGHMDVQTIPTKDGGSVKAHATGDPIIYGVPGADKPKTETLPNGDTVTHIQPIDATDAEVLPPKKDLADDDRLPGIPPPDLVEWQDYKLIHVPAKAYKGRALGGLDKDSIDVLHEKRGLPHLQATDPGIRTEAEMIEKAYAEWQKAP